QAGGHGALVERWHVREGRRRRRAEDTVQEPYPTNDRRCSGRVRGDGQDAALPQQPAAVAVRRQGHAAKAAAVDIWNPIVLGKALIEKGVVRPDQIEHAAILADYAVEKELGLLPEGLTQVVVEVREETRVRADRFQIA